MEIFDVASTSIVCQSFQYPDAIGLLNGFSYLCPVEVIELEIFAVGRGRYR